MRSQYQQVASQLKSANTTQKQAMDPVRTIWSQDKGVWGTIKQQETQKQAKWNTFHQSMKAKDYTAASDALTQIIDLKKQIISVKQQIISAKQNVTTDLNGITGTGSQTPSPSAPSQS